MDFAVKAISRVFASCYFALSQDDFAALYQCLRSLCVLQLLTGGRRGCILALFKNALKLSQSFYLSKQDRPEQFPLLI